MKAPAPVIFFWSLAALSGFAALGHQLVWTRRMADLMGVGEDAATRVFGAFFLGLAVGSFLAAKLVTRTRRPWRWIAAAELAVALAVVPLFFLPGWIEPIWRWIGPEGLDGAAGIWLRTVGSLLLLLPPSIAMGFFLPLALPTLLASGGRLGRKGMVVYGINTLGGVLGLGFTLTALLPALGANGTLAILIAANLVTAVGALVMERLSVTVSQSPAAPALAEKIAPARDMSRGATIAWTLPIAMAALSGFCVLAAEIAGFHLVQLAAPISYQAAGALLAAVLLTLGGAALLYPWFERVCGGAESALARALSLAALATLATPALFHLVVVKLRVDLFAAGSATAFTIAAIGLALLILGPAFAAAGLVFPAACAADERRSGPGGAGFGWLIAVNGLAAFTGAELAQHLSLPRFGLHGTVAAVGIVYAAATVIALPRGASTTRMATALAVLGLGILAFPALSRLPTVNPNLPFAVLERTAGREGGLAVIEGPALGRAILVQNQYMFGSSGNHAEQQRLGALPLLLHPAPRQVAYLGLATGITASASIEARGVEHVEAVELSPTVARLAGRWFSEANADILSSPKARVVIEDARIRMAAHTAAFDVIVGDLFLPWGPGEARLFTADHFRSVRRALRADGVFCQWLPLHQLTEAHLAIILASFNEAFPDFEVFARGFGGHTPLIGLIGWENGASRVDWEIVAARIAEEGARVRDPLLGHASGLALLHLGRPEPAFYRDAKPDSLNALRLEILAGRDQIAGSAAAPYLTGERWHALRPRLFPAPPPPPLAISPEPEAFRALAELLHRSSEPPRPSASSINRPDAPSGEQLQKIRHTAALALPADYLSRPHLDWSLWTGAPLR